MSEIKRPIRRGQYTNRGFAEHYWDVIEADRSPLCSVFGESKDDAQARADQVVAAVNDAGDAEPDAGDVEAAFVEDHGLDPDAERDATLLNRLSDAERHERESAAREAQLRQALGRFLRIFPRSEIEMARECWGNTNTHLVIEGRKDLEAALATPASQAATNIQSVIEKARNINSAAYNNWSEVQELQEAVRVFDGKDGAG